jgi:hypothetical protein
MSGGQGAVVMDSLAIIFATSTTNRRGLDHLISHCVCNHVIFEQVNPIKLSDDI